MLYPAFSSPAPLTATPIRSARCSKQMKPNLARPRMTADPPTEMRPPETRPQPQPSPLTPPAEVYSTRLTSSLYKLFASSQTPLSALSFLPSQVVWQNPLLDLTASEIASTLKSFVSFAENPTITIYEIDKVSNSFSWTLSFYYPLPWRPRVAVAGTTTTDDLDNPTTITDEWYVHPISLIQQALPKLPDILWLYPGPHAETDDGTRKLLLRNREYDVVQFAPRDEVRCLGSVKEFEKELMFATPTLPEQAFEGGLRRREKYAAVAPIATRVLGEAVEWAVPVPGSLNGSSDVLLAKPEGDGVSVVGVGKRVMAVARFGGFAVGKVVRERVHKLLEQLSERGVEVTLDRIWVRVYDCKVGFNGRGKLAMAMYGSSTGVPRRNEIAVDLTGLVDESFWKR